MKDFKEDISEDFTNDIEEKTPSGANFFRIVAILFVLAIYAVIFLKIMFLS